MSFRKLQRLTRYVLPTCLVASLLTSCSRFYAPPLFDAIRLALRGLPDAPVSREQIDSLPYASISAKVGKAQRSVLVLGRYDHEDLHWISADRGVLVTRRGRLVKTVGFNTNLIDTIELDEDPVGRAIEDFVPGTLHKRTIDLQPGNRFGVLVNCSFERDGSESITILERNYNTLLIHERCDAKSLDWTFENSYWIDPHDGFVWRSVQHFAPDVPAVEIAVLKPAL